MPITDPELVLAILSLMDATDLNLRSDIWWRCDGEYAPISFFVNCNDEFYWASADAEPIESLEDVENIRKAIEDVKCLRGNDNSVDWELKSRDTGLELFVARKRGMRPQQPSYKECYPPESWPLFNACGPERDPREEG